VKLRQRSVPIIISTLRRGKTLFLFTVKLKASPLGPTSDDHRSCLHLESSSNRAHEGRGSTPTRSGATARPRWLAGIHSLVSPISVQIHMMHALKDDSAELTERLCTVSSDVV